MIAGELTQKDRVLMALKGMQWVRIKFLIEELKIYQYNSVIHALRKDGWDIRHVVKKIGSFDANGYTLYKNGEVYVKTPWDRS